MRLEFGRVDIVVNDDQPYGFSSSGISVQDDHFGWFVRSTYFHFSRPFQLGEEHSGLHAWKSGICSSPTFQCQGQIRNRIDPGFGWSTCRWAMTSLTSIASMSNIRPAELEPRSRVVFYISLDDNHYASCTSALLENKIKHLEPSI